MTVVPTQCAPLYSLLCFTAHYVAIAITNLTVFRLLLLLFL